MSVEVRFVAEDDPVKLTVRKERLTDKLSGAYRPITPTTAAALTAAASVNLEL